MVTTAAAAGYSAYSGYQQQKDEAARAKYNQQVKEQEAKARERAGRAAVDEKREETRRLLAAQRAAYGASGVGMEGSPMWLQLEHA